MITWIQVLLQKHHKIIFSVLLFVIIIAFVFTIGSSIPFFGGRDGSVRVSRQNFYGYNLDDRAQMAQLQRQAILDLNLSGIRPDNNSLTFKMLESAYLQSVAKNMCINRVSDADFEKFVKSLPAFQKGGSFDAEAWKDFSQNFTRQMGLSDEQFAAMLASIAAERRVQKLFVGPGYATDAEIARSFEQINGVWNLSVASLPYEKFDPKTNVSDEDLQKYLDLNKEVFRIPAAVGFDVVFFAAKDFPPAANENFSEEELEKFYKQTIRKYLTQDEKGFKIKDFKDVKEEVVKDLKNENAINRALTKAEDVLTSIYDSEAKFASGEFKKILAEAKLSVKALPLVRPAEKAPEGVPGDVLAAAFAENLNSEKFYCDPIRTDDGAYLVFFRESKPSYIPQLNQVKEQVKNAYLDSKKREAFSALGRDLSEKLKGEVAKGGEKVFAETVKAAGFEVKNLEKFSFAKPESAGGNQSLIRVLASCLPKMAGGDVSSMLNVGGTGYIVYAKSFEAPSASAGKEDLKNLAKSVEAESAQMSAMGVFDIKIRSKLPKNSDE